LQSWAVDLSPDSSVAPYCNMEYLCNKEGIMSVESSTAKYTEQIYNCSTKIFLFTGPDIPVPSITK